MSYGKDPDIMIRGVGAIASRDAGSVKRLRRRIARARATVRRDTRVRNLTYDQLHGLGVANSMQVAPHPTYGAGTMNPWPSVTTTGGPDSSGTPGYTVGTPPNGAGSGPSVLTMYVCPDGTRVTDASMCRPVMAPPEKCWDGSTAPAGTRCPSPTEAMPCPDGSLWVLTEGKCVPKAMLPPPPPLTASTTNPWLIVAGIGALYLLFRDRE